MTFEENGIFISVQEFNLMVYKKVRRQTREFATERTLAYSLEIPS